jgi:hypothetical protein
MTESNEKRLGDIGEKIVAHLTNSILSENYWDSEKDMTGREDKKKKEVKTQVRHVSRGEMTVNENQEEKCTKRCDELYFVEYDNTDLIYVYLCEDRHNFSRFTTSKGEKRIGWKIDKMKVIKVIRNADLAKKMRSLSKSTIIQK